MYENTLWRQSIQYLRQFWAARVATDWDVQRCGTWVAVRSPEGISYQFVDLFFPAEPIALGIVKTAIDLHDGGMA